MFWNQVLSSTESGLAAGAFAVIATMLVEKFGGIIGGTISAIPFTFIPGSYVLITSAKSSADWKASISSVAFACFGDLVFVEMWKVLPPRIPKEWNKYLRVVLIGFLSSVVWIGACFGCTIIFFLIRSEEDWIVPCGLLAWIIHLILSLSLSWNALPSKKGKKRISFCTYFNRGVLAFCTICFGAMIAKMGSLIVATVVTEFPAIFLTTLASMFISHGDDVGLGATGPLMLGGDAWAAFAAILSTLETYTPFPTFVNIGLTLLLTIFCVSIPSVFYLKWREKKSGFMRVEAIELPVTNGNNNNNNNNNEEEEMISSPIISPLSPSTIIRTRETDGTSCALVMSPPPDGDCEEIEDEDGFNDKKKNKHYNESSSLLHNED